MAEKTRKLKFFNNVMIYRRFEIHEVPEKEADIFIKAGVAQDVGVTAVKEVDLTESLAASRMVSTANQIKEEKED